jgi:glycosyltransferase involved in cell wall biosynthesis
MRFRGFKSAQPGCTYVKFNNIWGVRNFSRSSALKKALKDFIAVKDPQKLILAYCPHTPFLEAAAYAKKHDPSIRVCLYVPDLPNYMNLSASRTWFYDVAKKVDINRMTKLMQCVDSYVLLTEYMKEHLPVGDKPYRVAEGIIETMPQLPEPTVAGPEKYVVYTGKLFEKFGVKTLIDGFMTLQNPDYRLVLCGKGDCEAYARAAQSKDPRIMFLGQVSPQEALGWQSRASALINPRNVVEEYTRYSFPSKNIEYLLSGKPVVGYFLEGMPQQYRDFLCCIDPTLPPEQGIAAKLDEVLSGDSTALLEKNKRFFEYAREPLVAKGIAQSIIDLSF